MNTHRSAERPTGWLAKATIDLDESQFHTQMREALSTPAAIPFGVVPATEQLRGNDALARIMTTTMAPDVPTQDALVTTRPERSNADEQLLAQREARGSTSAPGRVIPLWRRS